MDRKGLAGINNALETLATVERERVSDGVKAEHEAAQGKSQGEIVARFVELAAETTVLAKAILGPDTLERDELDVGDLGKFNISYDDGSMPDDPEEADGIPRLYMSRCMPEGLGNGIYQDYSRMSGFVELAPNVAPDGSTSLIWGSFGELVEVHDTLKTIYAELYPNQALPTTSPQE